MQVSSALQAEVANLHKQLTRKDLDLRMCREELMASQEVIADLRQELAAQEGVISRLTRQLREGMGSDHYDPHIEPAGVGVGGSYNNSTTTNNGIVNSHPNASSLTTLHGAALAANANQNMNSSNATNAIDRERAKALEDELTRVHKHYQHEQVALRQEVNALKDALAKAQHDAQTANEAFSDYQLSTARSAAVTDAITRKASVAVRYVCDEVSLSFVRLETSARAVIEQLYEHSVVGALRSQHEALMALYVAEFRAKVRVQSAVEATAARERAEAQEQLGLVEAKHIDTMRLFLHEVYGPVFRQALHQPAARAQYTDVARQKHRFDARLSHYEEAVAYFGACAGELAQSSTALLSAHHLKVGTLYADSARAVLSSEVAEARGAEREWERERLALTNAMNTANSTNNNGSTSRYGSAARARPSHHHHHPQPYSNGGAGPVPPPMINMASNSRNTSPTRHHRRDPGVGPAGGGGGGGYHSRSGSVSNNQYGSGYGGSGHNPYHGNGYGAAYGNGDMTGMGSSGSSGGYGMSQPSARPSEPQRGGGGYGHLNATPIAPTSHHQQHQHSQHHHHNDGPPLPRISEMARMGDMNGGAGAAGYHQHNQSVAAASFATPARMGGAQHNPNSQFASHSNTTNMNTTTNPNVSVIYSTPQPMVTSLPPTLAPAPFVVAQQQAATSANLAAYTAAILSSHAVVGEVLMGYHRDVLAAMSDEALWLKQRALEEAMVRRVVGSLTGTGGGGVVLNSSVAAASSSSPTLSLDLSPFARSGLIADHCVALYQSLERAWRGADASQYVNGPTAAGADANGPVFAAMAPSATSFLQYMRGGGGSSPAAAAAPPNGSSSSSSAPNPIDLKARQAVSANLLQALWAEVHAEEGRRMLDDHRALLGALHNWLPHRPGALLLLPSVVAAQPTNAARSSSPLHPWSGNSNTAATANNPIYMSSTVPVMSFTNAVGPVNNVDGMANTTMNNSHNNVVSALGGSRLQHQAKEGALSIVEAQRDQATVVTQWLRQEVVDASDLLKEILAKHSEAQMQEDLAYGRGAVGGDDATGGAHASSHTSSPAGRVKQQRSIVGLSKYKERLEKQSNHARQKGSADSAAVSLSLALPPYHRQEIADASTAMDFMCIVEDSERARQQMNGPSAIGSGSGQQPSEAQQYYHLRRILRDGAKGEVLTPSAQYALPVDYGAYVIEAEGSAAGGLNYSHHDLNPTALASEAFIEVRGTRIRGGANTTAAAHMNTVASLEYHFDFDAHCNAMKAHLAEEERNMALIAEAQHELAAMTRMLGSTADEYADTMRRVSSNVVEDRNRTAEDLASVVTQLEEERAMHAQTLALYAEERGELKELLLHMTVVAGEYRELAHAARDALWVVDGGANNHNHYHHAKKRVRGDGDGTSAASILTDMPDEEAGDALGGGGGGVGFNHRTSAGGTAGTSALAAITSGYKSYAALLSPLSADELFDVNLSFWESMAGLKPYSKHRHSPKAISAFAAEKALEQHAFVGSALLYAHTAHVASLAVAAGVSKNGTIALQAARESGEALHEQRQVVSATITASNLLQEHAMGLVTESAFTQQHMFADMNAHVMHMALTAERRRLADQHQLDALRAQVEHHAKEHAASQAAMAKLHSSIRDKEQRLALLSTQSSALTASNWSSGNEIAALKAEVDLRQARIDDLEQRLEILQSVLNSEVEVNKKALAAREATLKDLSSAHAYAADLSRQKRSLSRERERDALSHHKTLQYLMEANQFVQQMDEGGPPPSTSAAGTTTTTNALGTPPALGSAPLSGINQSGAAPSALPTVVTADGRHNGGGAAYAHMNTAAPPPAATSGAHGARRGFGDRSPERAALHHNYYPTSSSSQHHQHRQHEHESIQINDVSSVVGGGGGRGGGGGARDYSAPRGGHRHVYDDDDLPPPSPSDGDYGDGAYAYAPRTHSVHYRAYSPTRRPSRSPSV